MLCPIKFVDPSAHLNLKCETQCAWRAAEVTKQTEDDIEVYYYCGLISNSTRIEMVNLDGPEKISLKPHIPEIPEMPMMPEIFEEKEKEKSSMLPVEVIEDNKE